MTTTFTLTLINTKHGLLLEGRAPGKELEYYDLDGEGGKASAITFAPWNQQYSVRKGVETGTYTDDDTDSFWAALEAVLESARAAGVELPDASSADARP